MPRKSLVLLVLVVALVSAACTSRGSDAAHKPVPATNATTAPLLPTDAQALPDFTTDQYHQLLGQLKGTPVVVNLWGSWCGPCRLEAPLLKKASDTFGKQIQFIGVDILDAKPSAQKYMNEFGLTFPSVFDPSGGGDIRNQLGYIGQPDTLFYDASGRLVTDHEGQITEQELTEDLAKILPGQSTSPIGTHNPFSPTPSP